MTVSGGRAGHWANNVSGVRNWRAGASDHAYVLPRVGEKFEITGRHAEGATCEVFKAHHVDLDIAVAIKVLRPEYATDPHFLERMRIEAQVLPRLKSRHIVQCFDRGVTEDGRPYTVLEFLRGQTLEEALERVGTLDEDMTIELGTELLEAMAAVHARGIVHRDVSLRNLIVHRTELEPATLKLIDFGFATIMPGAHESAPEPAAWTERDAAVGTPRFVAPEVAMGRAIDGRADLYSAGIVLYWLLAGRDPFAEIRSPEAVLEAHAHRTVPPLSLHTRSISPELERFVMRLLQKERALRFDSADHAARALTDLRKAIRERAERRYSSSVPAARLEGATPSQRRERALPPAETLKDAHRIVAGVRRRVSAWPKAPAAFASSSLETRAIDANHAVGVWGTTVIQIWRGAPTGAACAEMNQIAGELVSRACFPITCLYIVERCSPPPDEDARRNLATFSRNLVSRMSIAVVVAEGGGFRGALVRAVGVALTTLVHHQSSLRFVNDMESALRLLAPHLQQGSGGAGSLASAADELRKQIDRQC